MENCEISRDRALAFHRSLASAGLARIFPDDSLILVLGNTTSLDTLSFLSKKHQCWFHAKRNDSIVTAERRPISVVTSLCLLNGMLETSLLEAILQYGLGPFLACRLSDIFAWDINFFLDPRKGDTFQIVFTQKYAEGRFAGYGDILAARYSCNGRDFYAIGLPNTDGRLQYYDLNGKSVQKEFLKAPLRYSRISSSFTYHRKHPILGIIRPHLAIDYAAPHGTPVYSAADGIVRKADWDKNYGNNVEIAHGGAYVTLYGHLATISSGIRRGTYVTQGQMIGTVGATGCATGPHLDYRMKKNGSAVNPRTVNLPSKRGIVSSEYEAFNRVRESYCAVLNFRHSNTTGYHVLNLERQIPMAADPQQSPPYSVIPYGVKSGS